MTITFAVHTEQLTRRFGEFIAVDQLNLSVTPGEVFGFLGPNGSGKTTTIRMLCGLLTPSSGTGQVLGFDIARQSEEIKQQIGYMSQKFSLYPDLTVRENLRFYADVYGVRNRHQQQRLAELIDMAGLTGREYELTVNLSGGWKQRLALACAIVHQPRMLFLDEPTGGVDPEARRAFWDAIYDFAQTGVTVFVTTHYMDEAEHCHRIGMMHGGKMVALGTPAELKHQVITGEVIEVETQLGEALNQELRRLPGITEVATHGARLHLIVDHAATRLPEIQTLIHNLGDPQPYLAQIDPSLEDVFVALVGAHEKG
jgi:ABC-2 type transport system ATP-binding protein